MRNEKLVLKDVRKGKSEAYTQIVRDHNCWIYSFLFHLTRDANIADDLTQETFISAWKQIENFNGRSSLKTWFYKIAHNKFIDFKRTKDRIFKNIDRFKEETNTKLYPEPLDEMITDEQTRKLYNTVQKLKDSDQELIVLHYFQELSFREISLILDEPIGTVKWRISQVLKRLKPLLEGKI